MTLPRDIIDRVDRVIEYHQASKYIDGSYQPPTDLGNRPPAFRSFDDLPKTSLPTTLLDAPVSTLSVLHEGLEAVPPSLQHPPQNLKTLASWLHLGAGLTVPAGPQRFSHSYPSHQDAYPCDVYVAAFGMTDLEPGLYHFSPKEFALRKMRSGPETLAVLKRGRPDLAMLRNLPAALLVSAIFARSTSLFQRRGYRNALLDSGQLTQNLVTAGNGLGIQTLVRLRLNEANTRDLIGIPFELVFGDAESVQSMIIWADPAERSFSEDIATPFLQPIPRPALPADIKSYGSILATHDDCVGVGLAIRDVRPPLTELSILAQEFPVAQFENLPPPFGGPSVRQMMTTRAATPDFQRSDISRDALWQISRVTFRGGTYFPLFPDGPQIGLIRPFWIVRAVTGMEPGLWYYRPQTDQWNVLAYGDFSEHAAHLALDNYTFANAAAVCVLLANLNRLLTTGGPDLYRLAHLEAGIAAQRIYLAAASQSIATQLAPNFFDDAVRATLSLEKTGWEPLYMIAIGQAAPIRPNLEIPASMRRTRPIDFYREMI